MKGKKKIKLKFINFLIDLKQINKNLNLKFNKKEIVEINKPLVLISQIQRSGGTLLNQLFDNHKELFVYPCELMIGNPKWNWPDNLLNMNKSKVYKFMWSRYLSNYILNGYNNEGVNKNKYSFNLIRRHNKKIFYSLMNQKKITSNREIIDIYFSSFFNSYENYKIKNEKKYILAFVPRLIMNKKSVKNYFTDYENGKIISIIRDPINWYFSARKHGVQYEDLHYSINLWNKSFDEIIENKRIYGDKVKIILFEQLIKQTNLIMSNLSNWLKIDYNNNLLEPTYFGEKIKADSSYVNKKSGIINEPLSRSKLEEVNLCSTIKQLTMNRYERYKEKIKI